MLRPVLPGLADEIDRRDRARGARLRARRWRASSAQVVRLGVEVALSRFLDLLAGAEPGAAERARTYVDLGRGEFHAGRSLDALLAAYRVGARLAWRRFVEAGVAAGLGRTRSTRSARRSSPTSTSSRRSRPRATPRSRRPRPARAKRRRRRLVRLLAQDPPPARRRSARRPPRPRLDAPARRRCRRSSPPTPSDDAPGEALLDSVAARLARRLGEDAVGAEAFGAALVVVPDPRRAGPAAPARVARRDGPPAALGPTVAVDRRRGQRAPRGATHALAAAGRLPRRIRRPRARRRPRTTSPHLLLAADRALAADLARAAARAARRARRRPARAARARRSPPGSTAPARCRPSRRRSASTRRPSATACASCATSSATRLDDPEARFELSLALRAR